MADRFVFRFIWNKCGRVSHTKSSSSLGMQNEWIGLDFVHLLGSIKKKEAENVFILSLSLLLSLAPSLSLYVCVCSYLIWQLSATYTHIHIDIDIYTHIQDINKGWLVETNIEIQHRFRLLLPCLPVTQERFNHILHQIKKIPNIYTQQDHHICLSLFLFVFRFWIPFCLCVCVIRRTHRSKNSVACPSQWVVKKLKIKKLLFQSI